MSTTYEIKHRYSSSVLFSFTVPKNLTTSICAAALAAAIASGAEAEAY
jgi:hypothetical protein